MLNGRILNHQSRECVTPWCCLSFLTGSNLLLLATRKIQYAGPPSSIQKCSDTEQQFGLVISSLIKNNIYHNNAEVIDYKQIKKGGNEKNAHAKHFAECDNNIYYNLYIPQTKHNANIINHKDKKVLLFLISTIFLNHVFDHAMQTLLDIKSQ